MCRVIVRTIVIQCLYNESSFDSVDKSDWSITLRISDNSSLRLNSENKRKREREREGERERERERVRERERERERERGRKGEREREKGRERGGEMDHFDSNCVSILDVHVLVVWQCTCTCINYIMHHFSSKNLLLKQIANIKFTQ